MKTHWITDCENPILNPRVMSFVGSPEEFQNQYSFDKDIKHYLSDGRFKFIDNRGCISYSFENCPSADLNNLQEYSLERLKE